VPTPGRGGATTDNYATVEYPAVAPLFRGTGIEAQVAAFPRPRRRSTGHGAVRVWGGPNDFFINPSARPPAPRSVPCSLTSPGCTAWSPQLLVPNMADLALAPFASALTPEERAGCTSLSLGYNTGPSQARSALWRSLPAINITPFDTSGSTIRRGESCGLRLDDVTDPCFDPMLGLCGSPDEYLYWDGAHPDDTRS